MAKILRIKHIEIIGYDLSFEEYSQVKYFRRISSIVLVAAAAMSCSTTKVLQDDQYRLSKNKIEVTNDKNFNVTQLQPYIKQKPNSYFHIRLESFS